MVSVLSALSVPGTYVFKARYYEGKAMVSENEVTVQVAPDIRRDQLLIQ